MVLGVEEDADELLILVAWPREKWQCSAWVAAECIVMTGRRGCGVRLRWGKAARWRQWTCSAAVSAGKCNADLHGVGYRVRQDIVITLAFEAVREAQLLKYLTISDRRTAP